MKKKQVWDNPYEAVKALGLKSRKSRNGIKTDWCVKSSGSFLETDGRDDVFDTHPLGRKAHVYGSSLK